MRRSMRLLAWQWVLVGAFLILGRVTVVWAGNVSAIIQDTGVNVGIGTTEPNYKLQVDNAGTGDNNIIDLNQQNGYSAGGRNFLRFSQGTGVPSQNFRIGFDYGTTSFQIRNSSDVPVATFLNGGNVGIGTMSPGAKLHIAGGNVALDNNQVLLMKDEMGTPRSVITTRNDGAVLYYGWHDSLIMQGVNGATYFYTSGTGQNPMTLAGGNVGIGTPNPATKLHVAGDAQVDGNLAAKYQDVAEWVKTSSPMPQGTVVVIDPHGHDQILPASQSYDTRVAGVVSARPGLLLGEAGEGKVKVAQSGRVKVKVDAAYGPIAAGDLLVTSPTPGHAMRSSPVKLGETLIHRPGTLLGKALEPLEEGQGEILVLLTLQ